MKHVFDGYRFFFVQGMGDFLSEMAVMMNQSKPSVSQSALVSHMF